MIYYYHFMPLLISGKARPEGTPSFHDANSLQNYTFGPFESFHHRRKIAREQGQRKSVSFNPKILIPMMD